MNPTLQGKARCVGDDISTDGIIPARYLTSYLSPSELATHALEGADPEFSKRVRPGDLLVGGKNFGCGSSREEAVVAIQASGIAAVIAKSFGRIFFRNAVNRGLMVLECPLLSGQILEGDELELLPREGVLRNITRGVELPVRPLAEAAAAILEAGGLLPYVKARIRTPEGENARH